MSSAWQLTCDLSTGFARAGFNRAKFARGGALQLFTIVNKAGEGHVLLWEQVGNYTLFLPRTSGHHAWAGCSLLGADLGACREPVETTAVQIHALQQLCMHGARRPDGRQLIT